MSIFNGQRGQLALIAAIVCVALAVGCARKASTEPVPAARCPYASAGLPDGCAGADPNGSFTFQRAYGASFGAYARQSGQSWTSDHPWAWDAPGVDYPVGYDMTIALHDPSDVNWVNPVTGKSLAQQHCHYGLREGSTTAHELDCQDWADFAKGVPTGSIDIEGYDFSGALTPGAPGCIDLYIQNWNGPITVKNNKWASVNPATGACAWQNGWMVRADSKSPAVLVTQNGFGYDSATATTDPGMIGFVDICIDGQSETQASVEYNYFGPTPGRDIAAPCGKLLDAFNVFDGINVSTKSHYHGEVSLAPVGVAGAIQIDRYDVVVFGKTSQANTTAFFWTGAPNVAMALAEADHNIVATNRVNGKGVPNDSSGVVEVGGDDNTYGAIVVEDNFVDTSGIWDCLYPFSPRTTLTLAGNVSLNSGLAINSVGVSAGRPGCK
ncbi:MAG: hypothetical protein ACRED9_13230 [Caulobacteraceae bacterium]